MTSRILITGNNNTIASLITSVLIVEGLAVVVAESHTSEEVKLAGLRGIEDRVYPPVYANLSKRKGKGKNKAGRGRW